MLHAIEMQISLKNKEWFCVYGVCVRCVFVCVFSVCACSGAAVGEEGRKLDKFGEKRLGKSHTHSLTHTLMHSRRHHMTRRRPADFQTHTHSFWGFFFCFFGRTFNFSIPTRYTFGESAFIPRALRALRDF